MKPTRKKEETNLPKKPGENEDEGNRKLSILAQQPCPKPVLQLQNHEIVIMTGTVRPIHVEKGKDLLQ